MNYRMILEYDGTRYHGWQRHSGVTETVQGKLEEILSRYFSEDIEVFGSGRTDAGVHAEGQVANFHTAKFCDTEKTARELNGYLPEDIRIKKLEKCGERFHARLNAKGKAYVYTIYTGVKAPVFRRDYVAHLPGRLDCEAMREAAALLEGTHDFKAFSAVKKTDKSTVRTIYSIEIAEAADTVSLRFYGSGFLRKMVRIMTGTLVEVGRHERKPETILQALTSLDRADAAGAAPAQGLCLERVYYD